MNNPTHNSKQDKLYNADSLITIVESDLFMLIATAAFDGMIIEYSSVFVEFVMAAIHQQVP